MEISKDRKIALLFGIDTQIGEYCLRFLEEHGAYERVVVFSNKKLVIDHPNVEVKVCNFESINSFAEDIQGNDLFYCTSSFLQKTTYLPVTGTSTLNNALLVAKIAASNKVNQLIFLSSQGASKESMFPTSQLKGELEEIMKSLPFWAIHIFKPSLLIGPLSENRWGEQLASWLGERLDQLTGGFVSKYKPIEADAVAKAMIQSAQLLRGGVHIYNADYLRKMAQDYDDERKALGE